MQQADLVAVEVLRAKPGLERRAKHLGLAELRDASDGSDPRITARMRTALRAIFGK